MLPLAALLAATPSFATLCPSGKCFDPVAHSCKPCVATTTTTATTPPPSVLPTANDAPSAPLRSTAADVSMAVLKPGSAFLWWRGQTATQVMRDDLEQTIVGVLVPELVLYVRRTNPACSTWGFVYSALRSVFASEGWNTLYPQRAVTYAHSAWQINANGRFYGYDVYVPKRLCQCLQIGAPADLWTFCFGPGTPPGTAFDPARANAGVETSQHRMPPPNPVLLHATHTAHVAVSDWRCGGPEPPPGIVEAAHRRLEASARSESEHHFFRMKNFSGLVDPGWTHDHTPTSEECRWGRLQDRFHGRWIGCEEAGDWGCAEQAQDDHQLAHVCMNIGTDDRLVVRFSCGAYIGGCPVQTCREALSSL
jgi:hypothetical protein